MESGIANETAYPETLKPHELRDVEFLIQILRSRQTTPILETPADTPTVPPILPDTDVIPASTQNQDTRAAVAVLESPDEPKWRHVQNIITKRRAVALASVALAGLFLFIGNSSSDSHLNESVSASSSSDADSANKAEEQISKAPQKDKESARTEGKEKAQTQADKEDSPKKVVADNNGEEKTDKIKSESKESHKNEKKSERSGKKDTEKSHETLAKEYIRPVGYEYEITCPLNGYENISGFHTGVDYGTPENTIVKAPRGGVVVAMGTSGGAGRYLTIKHKDGRLSIFQHLNSYFVNVGEGVEQGAEIARTGSTGTKDPHLHWTLTKPEAVSDGDIPSKDDAGVENRVENPQNFYN